MNPNGLKPFLDRLYEKYNTPQFLTTDPVQFVHEYSDPKDREIAAFVAASFAYGNAKLIIRSVRTILAPCGPSPHPFLKKYNGENLWKGFVYRFHREEHLPIYFSMLAKIIREHGSFEAFYKRQAERFPNLDKCEGALSGAGAWFHQEIEKTVSKTNSTYRGLRFLFNTPGTNSACKRNVMFLRFVVRRDEIDRGMWTWIQPSELKIPADTHVTRIAFYLGLREGRETIAPTWKTVTEISNHLSAICPEDPIRYDFALSRLGILNLCRKQWEKSICIQCALERVCKFSAHSRKHST